MMKEYDFDIEMEVRDYELDTQGVVNNSVYQNYLEHARHQFLKEMGINFNGLHADGVDAVVHKIELEYKRPLVGDDTFIVRSRVRRKGHVRYIFDQDIYKKPDRELMLKGVVTSVFMNNGRPIRPPLAVIEALDAFRENA